MSSVSQELETLLDILGCIERVSCLLASNRLSHVLLVGLENPCHNSVISCDLSDSPESVQKKRRDKVPFIVVGVF